MTSADFREKLLLATHGNQNAVLQILQLYAPLISHASMIAGHEDEDLQQVIKSLHKFKI